MKICRLVLREEKKRTEKKKGTNLVSSFFFFGKMGMGVRGGGGIHNLS